MARVNQAKSAAKQSRMQSPSQSVDSMTNASSLLYNNPLVNRFMEKIVPLPLPSTNTSASTAPTTGGVDDDGDKAICRVVEAADDNLAVCPALHLSPTPSLASYQRAILAAINYTKHISVDDEAQLHLIHLLLCLEQAVVRSTK